MKWRLKASHKVLKEKAASRKKTRLLAQHLGEKNPSAKYQ